MKAGIFTAVLFVMAIQGALSHPLSSIEDDANDCSDCTAFISDFQNAIMHNKKIVSDWTSMLNKECESFGSEGAPICKSMVGRYFPRILQGISSMDTNTICKDLTMCGSPQQKRVGDQCMDCKSFFSDVQKKLKSEQSAVAKLDNEIIKECATLKEGLKEMCTNLLKQNLPKFWKMFEQADVGQVCVKLEFCTSEMFVKALSDLMPVEVFDVKLRREQNQVAPENVADSVKCDVCHLVATELSKVLTKDSTEEEIEKALDEVCNILPNDYKTECDTLVHEYGPTIVQLLAKELAPDVVCKELKLCTGLSITVEGEPCGDCKNFILDLQDAIKNNKPLVQEITDLVKQECDQLDPAIAGLCKTFVDQYAPVAENAITGNDAGLICSTIEMCSGIHTRSNLRGDICSDCEAFVSDWQYIIVNNQSIINDITNLIQQECKSLGAAFEKLCDSAVKQYLPMLWEAISSSDADSVCATVYFCDFENPAEAVEAKVLNIIEQESTECDVCHLVVTELDKVLSKDSTEAEIEKALNEVCGILPEDLKTECGTLVNEYGPTIVQLLMKELTPDAVCKELKLCTSSSPEVKVEDSVDCDVCHLVVTELDKMLAKDSTEAGIEKALKEVCGILPEQYKTECSSLVDEFGPTIVQLLMKELTPDAVCKELKLCGASYVEVEGEPCGDCKNFISDLQDAIKNGSPLVQEITDLVKQECDQLDPAIAGLCKTFVDQYAPIAENAITGNDAGLICSTIEMCSGTTQSVTSDNLRGDICSDCEAFVSDWQYIIVNNQSIINDITSLIQQECKSLGAAFEKLCDSAVKQYLPMLWEAISSSDADSVCATVYFCDFENPAKAVEDKVLNLIEQIPTEIVEESTECDVCHLVVQELDKVLSKDSTEAEIEKALNEVCGILPESIKAECTTLVNEFGPTIVQLLMKELAPDAVCKELKLCTSSIPEVNIEDSTECDVCHLVVQELDKVLSKDSTEAEIEKALNEVCSILPESIKAECSTLVQEYGPTIVQLLMKELTPNAVCEELKLCTSSSPEGNIEGSTECDVCHLVVQELDKVLSKDSTEAEIEKALNEVCGILPESIKAECSTLVQEYGPTIVQLLMKELTPNAVCKELKLCTSSTPGANVEDSTECDVCHLVVQELDKVLSKDSTEAEIEKALNEVCGILPEDLKTECGTLVNEYGPTIVQLLMKELTPDTVFKELKLCTSFSSEVEGEPCGDCRNFISDLQGAIKNDNPLVQEITDLAKQECDQLDPAIAGVCRTFVNQYAPVIENAITGNDAGLICSTIEMCSGSSMNVRGDLCSDCQAFTIDWQGMIVNNQSVITDINNLIVQECLNLGVEFKSLCDSVGKQYLPMLWNAISSNDAETICATLYFCEMENPVEVLKAERLRGNSKEASKLECNACKFVIEEVEKMVQDNKTEENIAKALTNVCEIYGEDIRQECHSFIEQYGADIIDFIILEMNSFEICTKLGLCKSSLQKALVETPNNVEGGTECDICNIVLTELGKLVSSESTEKEILDAIGSVCSKLGKAEKECDVIVHEYGSTIINLIIQKLPPSEICTAIKLCTSKKLASTSSVNIDCDVCKALSRELDKLLREDATQAEIEKALDKVCTALPSNYRDTCDGLVTQFTPEIVSLLINELEPTSICPQLKLCPTKVTEDKISDSKVECEACSVVAKELDRSLKQESTQEEIDAALRKVCGLLPSDLKNACDNALAESYELIVDNLIKGMEPEIVCVALNFCPKENAVELTPGEVCDVCQLVALGLDVLLTRNFTVDELYDALDEVCLIVPESHRNTCHVLVKQLAINIVILSVEELNPSAICPELGYCPVPPPSALKKESSEISCDVCKFVATELDSILTDNATVAEIEKALLEVCNVLPESVRQECNSLIKKYGYAIVGILTAGISPSRICPELGLCPPQVKQVTSVAECDVCKVVMKEMKSLVTKESSEIDILKAVTKVCNVVPQQYRSVCDQYINDYGPGVISILADDFVPDQVCETLGVCRSSAISYPPRKLHVGSNNRCPLCRNVIGMVDELLKENFTQSDLEKELQKVCNYMPTSEVTECDALVNEFSVVIMQYADNIFDPSFICQHLKLCPTDSHGLLGEDPCMYGPTYWCQDVATAKRCNAYSHCANHVWDEKTM